MSLLTSQAANRNYAVRPADERFPSLAAMVTNAESDKARSIERSYNLKDLRATVEDDAVVLQSPKGHAKFTHWSFGQLARTVEAPAAYLRSLSPQLAADCLNFGLTNSPVGSTANLLVKAPNGDPTPTIRAATSETYGRVWDADLYGNIARQLTDRDPNWTLPPTWTGEGAGAYRGDRDSFLILTNGGSIVTDPTLRLHPSQDAGKSGPHDGMYRGILVRNSEVGAASVVIERILYRYVCGNHMLWGAMIDKSYRRRHVGANSLRDTIREIASIAYRWGNASAERDNAIIKALVDHEIAATKEGVIDELRKLGATKEQATAAYDTCEQKEAVSPRSFWGVAQGLTRLSQDGDGYQDERYSLDRIAASVMSKGARQYAMA